MNDAGHHFLVGNDNNKRTCIADPGVLQQFFLGSIPKEEKRDGGRIFPAG